MLPPKWAFPFQNIEIEVIEIHALVWIKLSKLNAVSFYLMKTNDHQAIDYCNYLKSINL